MISLNRRALVAASALLAPPRPGLADGKPSAPSASPGPGAQATHPAAAITMLNGDPQPIVVLEWCLLEQPLAAGVQPVGAAGIEGYITLVDLPLKLTDDAITGNASEG